MNYFSRTRHFTSGKGDRLHLSNAGYTRRYRQGRFQDGNGAFRQLSSSLPPVLSTYLLIYRNDFCRSNLFEGKFPDQLSHDRSLTSSHLLRPSVVWYRFISQVFVFLSNLMWCIASYCSQGKGPAAGEPLAQLL